MAKLIYASNESLDGCTEDERGAVDWAPPDDDVFVVITDLMRSAGTYLYGRRMYDTMAVWETDPALAMQSDLTSDFANAWQAADKVVYSTTLASVSTVNTRLERHFDPDAVHALSTDTGVDLELLDERRFRNGAVHLRYCPVARSAPILERIPRHRALLAPR